MRRPISLWLAATRPAFLTVTLVGVFIGIASAVHDHAFRSLSLAAITLLFALVAHAGANVINDYYDARSGCDDANTERIPPFTGGSRFIQDGKLTEHETWLWGYGLLVSVIPAGIWLVTQSGPMLLWIGLTGLLCGWAYSAPPLKLQSRGLGELAIMTAWLMVIIGSNYVQSQALNPTALFAGLAYAPLVANVLFVNQIPDRNADASAGKNTLIVRYGPAIAPWGSLALYALAICMLVGGIILNTLPIRSALALFAIVPASIGLTALSKNPSSPRSLKTAIPSTIFSCLSFGLLLSLGLLP